MAQRRGLPFSPLAQFFFWFRDLRYYSELLSFVMLGIALIKDDLAQKNKNMARWAIIFLIAGNLLFTADAMWAERKWHAELRPYLGSATGSASRVRISSSRIPCCAYHKAFRPDSSRTFTAQPAASSVLTVSGLDPFYQRAYAWAKEEQWEPLWNDAVREINSLILGN